MKAHRFAAHRHRERTFWSDVNVGLVRQFPEGSVDLVDFAVSMLTTTAPAPILWTAPAGTMSGTTELWVRCRPVATGGGAWRERSEGLSNCLDSPRRSARCCDCDASA